MNEIDREVAFGDKFDYLMARAVADVRYPGSTILRMHDMSDIDFAGFERNTFKFVIESKKRRVKSTDFDSTIVHRRKHEAARAALRHFKVTTLCAVLFDDALGYFNLSEDPDGTSNIERQGRDTIVPHVHYNHSRLIWLPEKFSELQAEIKRLETANA